MLRYPASLFFLLAISPVARSESKIADDGFTVVETLAEVRDLSNRESARVRLKPGTYILEEASSRHFIEFTGNNSRWDFRGVKLLIDTRLYSRFGATMDAARPFYCAVALKGDGIELEGLTAEMIGDTPGIQQKNKIIAITGSGVVLRNVEITTKGSFPWGYGSLFGIAGGDVKKMNGILVRWPAKNVKLIGCRVHMRAMGHAIFVQGADSTLIEDCHVDGLLRPTNDILAEKSGYAFRRGFKTKGRGYLEGICVGADGAILPDEMIALSEDGIRLYDRSPEQPTGSTTIVRCTVTRMRRGICTGLGPAPDHVINCDVRECVTTGFNVGSGDELTNCRADAKYSEALCLPYFVSHKANVELEILDSRGGLANALVAVINGQQHRVVLSSKAYPEVLAAMQIELATRSGYGFYQKDSIAPIATKIELVNRTPTKVVLRKGASTTTLVTDGLLVDDNITELNAATRADRVR